MSSRSLNKVILIGNLTKDPELRYTPQGTAVCTFGLATNRSWTTDGGEKREDTEFHRVVAWNKLAELCSQLLFKGRKVYIEGRLQTRSWTGQDGNQRQTTEIVAEEMIILDNRQAEAGRETQSVKAEEQTPVVDKVSETVSDVIADDDIQIEEKPEKSEETKVPLDDKTDKKADGDMPF